MPGNTASTEICKNSSLPLVTVAVVPLALGVLITSLKLLLWRARIVAQWLDEDASRVWTDGSMMLDCSNEGFHQSIIQNAIDRGTAALATSSTSNVTHVCDLKYHQSSFSSGESSEKDNISELASNENETNEDCPQKVMSRPRKMSKQVGGMASHKRPVLAFHRFILKPLRLVVRSRRILATEKDTKCERTMATRKNERTKGDNHHATNDEKDGINDETKAYRGVREVAFYEALEFVSTLPPDLGSFSEMFHRVGNKGVVGAGINAVATRQVVIYLLSLYTNETNKASIMSTADSSGDNNCGAIQPFYTSSIQSCRHPCIGYHNDKPCTKTESISSLRPHPILDSSSPPTNNSLLSNLGYFNSMALLAAYYSGDPVVLSSVQSYAHSWRALIKEVAALKRLSEFTSPYSGAVDLDSLKQDRNPAKGMLQPLQKPHLLLQNLTAPFHYPNIIDIKMGTQTYEPASPLSKQMREAKKYPQQTEIGFRIVGMRMYSPSADDDEYKCWDKSFGVNLKTREDIMRALMIFFHCDRADNRSSSYTHHVLSNAIQQLTRIKSWFEDENATLAFYGSSILIVYDGYQSFSDELVDRTSRAYQEPILKMIDFAHVCRQSGGDAGYFKGVRSLLSILEEISEGLCSRQQNYQ